MKRILVPVDFSTNAKHAAAYAYSLAKHIKADIVLCNAVMVPAEIPQAGAIVWPMENYDTLMKNSASDLEKLKQQLIDDDPLDGFHPDISCVNEAGLVANVSAHIVDKQKADMIVMGAHGSNTINDFLLGNHTRSMIEAAQKPLLIIPADVPVIFPYKVKLSPVKKIAFATDLDSPDEDLECIYNLIPFARSLNAEILITHVYDEKESPSAFQKRIDAFMKELSNNADYPGIYYRIVKNDKAEKGLNWLCVHGQVDILSMVHRKHGFFDTLLKGSHTQRLAKHLNVPLLVLQAKNNK